MSVCLSFFLSVFPHLILITQWDSLVLLTGTWARNYVQEHGLEHGRWRLFLPGGHTCVYHSEKKITHESLLTDCHHLPIGPMTGCGQAQSCTDLMLITSTAGDQGCHSDVMLWRQRPFTPVFLWLPRSLHHIFTDGLWASKRVMQNGWAFNSPFISTFWPVTSLYSYCCPLEIRVSLTKAKVHRSIGIY